MPPVGRRVARLRHRTGGPPSALALHRSRGECGTVSTWHPPPTIGSDAGRSELLRYRSGPGRWVIAATVLGSGMAAIDATVIGIALPTIGRDFHASLGTLQWVVTGYTLTLASLLLLGGSLGDRVRAATGVHDRGRPGSPWPRRPARCPPGRAS